MTEGKRSAVAMYAAMTLSLIVFVYALALAPRVEAQPSGSGGFYPTYAKTNINSNTTTQVLTGAGVLRAICINTKGASANTASVYDATSGTSNIFAVLDTVNTPPAGCLQYDAAVSNGIRIITATGTAADMTVMYRALR